ncbi:hypothetical protein BDZ45DRAFT_682171 [Acephala macrosclerotiorum]|nr:hypothetical protein BDZ45DRAFT_682171 [Acephala macrosclerotiorum]
MSREPIINGWLQDVYDQGTPACDGDGDGVNRRVADLEPPRKKRRMYAMEEPRVLRSNSRKESAYTVSINSALSLTKATALSQSSKGRARSRSPAKTVRDLENADPPTTYLQLRHPDNELPANVRRLNSQIVRSGRKGFMPISIRDDLTPHLEECDAEDDDLFDDVNPNTFKDILRIHTRARQCFELDKPEASWGEEVVRPLLDLAVEGRALVENITSTNIQPPSLIPRGSGVEGLPYEGKRVDYGLFISPTKEEVGQIKDRLKKLPDGEVWSINQTEAYYLREKPLFSSVELKKTRSNHDLLLQLAIWNSALFRRIEGLVNGAGNSMLPIPSITVAGHTWQVCYSYIDDDKTSRMLRGMLDIGSTTDIVGIYKLLRALETIVEYGTDEYWPWLSECLFS